MFHIFLYIYPRAKQKKTWFPATCCLQPTQWDCGWVAHHLGTAFFCLILSLSAASSPVLGWKTIWYVAALETSASTTVRMWIKSCTYYIYIHIQLHGYISVCVCGCVCDTTHTSRFSVPSNAYPTAGSFRVTTILGDGVVVLRPVIRLDSPKRVTQKAARVFQVSTVIFGKLTKTRPVIQLYSRNLSITCSVQFQIFSCILQVSSLS